MQNGEVIESNGCDQYYEEGIRVIFLDFDGVLNSEYSINNANPMLKRAHLNMMPALENIVHLNTIVRAFDNVKIVISSGWRRRGNWFMMRHFLYLLGMERPEVIIEDTPKHLGHVNRDENIQAWLDEYCTRTIKPWESRRIDDDCTYGLIHKFIILEDAEDLGDLEKYCIRTDTAVGLTHENALDAIELLT